jgi:hypothetical protein
MFPSGPWRCNSSRHRPRKPANVTSSRALTARPLEVALDAMLDRIQALTEAAAIEAA